MNKIEMAKKNKAFLIDFLLKDGTLSKNAIAGLLGTIQDECGFIPSMENLNYTTAARLREVWPDKFKGMSDADMAKYDTTSIKVEPANGKKCVRCWDYFDTLGSDKNHPELCDRCTHAVLEMNFKGE